MPVRAADLPGLIGAAVVALVVVLGGAFAPEHRVVVGVGFAAVAAAIFLAREIRIRSDEVALLAVLCWGGVSAAVAAGYPLAAKEMLGGWLVAWVLWVAVRRLGKRWLPVAGSFGAAAVVVVALAILLECLGAGRLRFGGLFVNPNVAAALLVPAVPGLWVLLRRSGRKAAAWAVVVPVILGVILTGSRAGLLALVVVIGIMLPRGKARLIGVTAVAAGAVAFLVWRFTTSPDSLAWHRLEIWRALWPLVVEHPLVGVGPGWLEEATGVVRIAHEGEIARFGHIIGSAESTPYGLLVRTGFVGFGLAGLGCWLWWRRASAAGDTARPPLRAMLAGIAVLALFHDYLDVDVVLWWWAVLLGAACVVVEDASDVPSEARSSWIQRAAAALAMVFVVLWTTAQPAFARDLWWTGPSSIELARRATRAETWFAEPTEWGVRNLLADREWTWPTVVQAIGSSRRAAAIHPGSARVWAEYAQVSNRVVEDFGSWADMMEGAREGFRRATELEPRLPWYWLQWAGFERSVGRSDEARRLAERAVDEEPNFVRGWLFLARLELDAGDLGAARAAYGRASVAGQLARTKLLTRYERDLLRAPRWQVEEIADRLSEN